MKARWIIASVLVLLFAAGGKWFVNEVSTTSAFMNAAYAGQTDVVAKLLKEGESADTKDPKGSTALIYAAQQGHLDTVRLLLNTHADINATTKLGQTALTQAAYNKHMDVVKLLLEHGATVDEIHRDSVLSAVEGNPDIVRMLGMGTEKPQGK